MSGPVTSRRYRWQPVPMMLSTAGLVAAFLTPDEGPWATYLPWYVAGFAVGLVCGAASHIWIRRHGWGRRVSPGGLRVLRTSGWLIGGLGGLLSVVAPEALQVFFFTLVAGLALPLCYAPGRA
jgi:hypothetical protein